MTPHSQSQPTAHDRLRDVIKEARDGCGNGESAPAIVQYILYSNLGKDIRLKLLRDRPVTRRLVHDGLSMAVRNSLKRHSGDDDYTSEGAKAAQLALWPEECAKLVGAIDRARLYVPSIAAFVELNPKDMTREQAREAAEYLIQHGQGEIRRGNNIFQLVAICPVNIWKKDDLGVQQPEESIA